MGYILSIKWVFLSFLKRWFGDFTRDEFNKYAFLGVIFACILGVYWTLRALKEPIFNALVGHGVYLAAAKMVSLALLLPLIVLYGVLVRRFSRNWLFYIMSTGYALLLVLWGIVFAYNNLGQAHALATPWCISGWLWYAFVESFGSFVPALFWAFVADVSDARSARYGFPLIALLGQFGGVITPRYLVHIPCLLGTCTSTSIVVFLAMIVVCIGPLVALFIRKTPTHMLHGFSHKKTIHDDMGKTGLFEGLRLLLTHRYLLGMFAMIAFFELSVTFIDFNFKNMVVCAWSCDQACCYLGEYGSAVNLVTFICILFGINNIQRWLGVRAALLVTPVIVGSLIVLFRMFYVLDVLFWLLIAARAIGYALQVPTLKQLYIPTSRDAKYKAQAWIDTFGSRSAKATSSLLNMSCETLGTCVYLSFIFYLSIGVVGAWLCVAWFLGNRYNKAVSGQQVVC